MDSFFDLFDPSDGQSKPATKKRQKPEDNVKKKTDGPPKGRRRGRRSQCKNETLPEESSFLCEPDLSTEVLVKDGSYIENFIEVCRRDDDTKADDSKSKRRNSTRKNRRKKSKTSPDKELEFDDLLNNQASIPKPSDGNVGKNVNDLRANNPIDKNFKECSIIDKLEKLGLKDDDYLMEDFDLDLDGYSSDGTDDSYEDSSSDDDDSSGEVYGSLPPEPRFGNVEYKLRLVSPCEKRFQHLVTQLKWRLGWGGGSAVYVVGVRDSGALRGLTPRAMLATLRTLRRMARALRAARPCVSARRLRGNRTVAEVCIRKLADTQSVEMRVAVMGANEAGKSTLIGVLTQGELDNGRGSARLNMFRHVHEVRSGRTSSLSHEILGFDAQGNVVNYGCSELMTAERIGERSAKLVSFLDLAGHTKYQRTTLHGLTGYSPHYAMLVISATAGITSITEEHISLLIALRLPFFVVINKCELSNAPEIMDRLAELVPKKPLLITDEAMARHCAATQKLRYTDDDDNEYCNDDDDACSTGVFLVSCVRGVGLRELQAYLLALPQQTTYDHVTPETCEFQIDEIFHVGDSGGPVVGGLLVRGQLDEGDRLIIGPLECGSFVPITVRSIYRSRAACGRVVAGQSASLGLAAPPRAAPPRAAPPRAAPPRAAPPRAAPPALRPGMVLLAVPTHMRNEKTRQNTINHKNFRRKNNNILQEIAKAEHGLSKDNINQENLYTESNDKYNNNLNQINDNSHKINDISHDKNDNSHKIYDISHDVNDNSHKTNDSHEINDNFDEKVINFDSDGNSNDGGDENDDKMNDDEYKFGDLCLEDPNNPRGCIFFQARVQILRHTSAISVGFQCSVHVGNVRQTAVIEGIMSRNSLLRVGETASVVFRFVRCPEYLVKGRRLLITAGLGTRAIGRITQIFPYTP